MDHTPKAKSKLSCRRINSANPKEQIATMAKRNFTSTPIQNSYTGHFNENSPEFLPSTQEVLDGLDVGWDWNSPHSAKHVGQNRKVKRTYSSPSLKLPVKRHPSNNPIQTFDKLKSDLEALRDQLNCETKTDRAERANLDFLLVPPCEPDIRAHNLDLEALFNDSSGDEELLLCSQNIEKTIGLTSEVNGNTIQRSQTDVTCNKKLNFEVNFNNLHKSDKNVNKIVQHCSTFGDDSFDLALETLKDEDIDLLSQAVVEKKETERSCDNKPDSVCNLEEIKKKRLEALAKLASKRNQGHESHNKMETVGEQNFILKKDPPSIKYSLEQTEQIKRRKSEAFAKLEAKKKLNYTSPEKMDLTRQYNDETSPIKCSPEEIEQKRLQALAKLEAKKKQDIIEKNRREALKRLEMNKKKRIVNSQRALVTKAFSSNNIYHC